MVFTQVTNALQDLNQKEPLKFPQPEINAMLEFEWNLYLEAKRKVSVFTYEIRTN